MIFDLTKRKSGGGDTYAVARALLDNTATEYIDDTITILRRGVFFGCSNLTTVKVHNVEYIKYFNAAAQAGAFSGCGVTTLALPKLRISSASTDGYRLFEHAKKLTTIDLGQLFNRVPAVAFFGCTNLSTIVLRSPTLAPLGSTTTFNGSPFDSGGTGGTIYIPKSLYDHLGDGTANDYKAATNWSTIDSYGTITWAKIEGSIYETQYADGTPIPTT